jgi:glutamate synthase (NADPH/NADH) small chain
VFIGIGLGATNALDIEGSDLPGVEDAVDFIARLRQSDDPATLPIGRDVVVIGGGMTAVDAAVQSRLLGAQTVTMVYRREAERMNASLFERELAQTNGVRIITGAVPVRVTGQNRVEAVEFAYAVQDGGALRPGPDLFTLPADQVLRAIGQSMVPITNDPADAIEQDGASLRTGPGGRTTAHGYVFAGGDCTATGENLTVTAVAQGRDAAMEIHATLMGDG